MNAFWKTESGTLLAVCSGAVLPLYAGILTKSKLTRNSAC